jgi:hypothetical protein
MDNPETNDELLARHKRVKDEVDKVKQQMERLKLGSPSRIRKAKWGGCLNFTLLQIESEMRERGLLA